MFFLMCFAGEPLASTQGSPAVGYAAGRFSDIAAAAAPPWQSGAYLTNVSMYPLLQWLLRQSSVYNQLNFPYLSGLGLG